MVLDLSNYSSKLGETIVPKMTRRNAGTKVFARCASLPQSLKHTCTSDVMICDQSNAFLCGAHSPSRVRCGGQVSIVEGVTLVFLTLVEHHKKPCVMFLLGVDSTPCGRHVCIALCHDKEHVDRKHNSLRSSSEVAAACACVVHIHNHLNHST